MIPQTKLLTNIIKTIPAAKHSRKMPHCFLWLIGYLPCVPLIVIL